MGKYSPRHHGFYRGDVNDFRKADMTMASQSKSLEFGMSKSVSDSKFTNQTCRPQAMWLPEALTAAKSKQGCLAFLSSFLSSAFGSSSKRINFEFPARF